MPVERRGPAVRRSLRRHRAPSPSEFAGAHRRAGRAAPARGRTGRRYLEWRERVTAVWLLAFDLERDVGELYAQLERGGEREDEEAQGGRLMATPRIGRPDVMAAHRADVERSWHTARVPVGEVATRAWEIADSLAHLTCLTGSVRRRFGRDDAERRARLDRLHEPRHRMLAGAGAVRGGGGDPGASAMIAPYFSSRGAGRIST